MFSHDGVLSEPLTLEQLNTIRTHIDALRTQVISLALDVSKANWVTNGALTASFDSLNEAGLLLNLAFAKVENAYITSKGVIETYGNLQKVDAIAADCGHSEGQASQLQH